MKNKKYQYFLVTHVYVYIIHTRYIIKKNYHFDSLVKSFVVHDCSEIYVDNNKIKMDFFSKLNEKSN